MSSKKITTRPGRVRRPLFIDPAEVSDMLGVSIPVLRSWRKAGTGPKFTQLTARTILYYRLDAMRWRTKMNAVKTP